MPWKLVRGSRGCSRPKGIIVLPLALSMSSGYLPGPSEGLISTSTKRYVPVSLTFTSDARSSGFREVTFAPRRLAPRTSSLTGLIVCLAHQEGGSTFVTEGFCATADATKNKKATTDQRTVVCCLRN